MIYGLYEEQAEVDDLESRRQHERYDCTDVSVMYTPFSSSYLKAVNSSVHTAKVKDISLSGLCIEVDTSLTVGDALSLSVRDAENNSVEELNVEVMWFKMTDNKRYNVGLRVLQELDLNFDADESGVDEEQASLSQNLICPSCNETSFYMPALSNERSTTVLHTCCRCNHSHPITQVIAFNRD